MRLGQGVTTGHVVNLVSTDTQSFDRVRCNLVKVNFCRTVIFLIILFIYNIDNENFFKVVIYSLVHRLLYLFSCVLIQFVTYLHFIWITPVQMVATMYLLWIQLGVSCFVPLALMLLLIIYQSHLGRVFAMLR